MKNYNSTLALSEYNLGDACACYIHNRHLERLATADVETVNKYSSTLTKITSDKSYAENDGKWLIFTRVIGVIVDKHEATDSKDIDTITVMFKTDDERYVLNKYVVNSHDIFINNKNEVPPAAVLSTVQEKQ